jgi:AMMECR1 domain-containing protein
MSHPLIDLARAAIRAYLETGELLDVSELAGDGPSCGLFVSLHDPPRPGEVEGDLRGCRGSVWPDSPTLYAELVRQAVNSAVDDPRCPSIQPDEVGEIAITVYLLQPAEAIHSLAELDPARYGILVEGESGRRALLLPGIPGIETAAQQVHLTRRKAHLHPDEPATIYRFTADVLK